MCDTCKNGDHSFHAGPHLAFICIGCPCPWKPSASDPWQVELTSLEAANRMQDLNREPTDMEADRG